jgi:hypothetical protein
MRLENSPFSPLVSLIVMVHIAEQQAGCCPMHDDEQIAGHPYRPEIPVAGRVQFVELESGISRIQLQIECSGLGSLLLLACKPRQAIDKRIRNPKFHRE